MGMCKRLINFAFFSLICSAAHLVAVQFPIEVSTWNAEPQTKSVSFEVPFPVNAAKSLYLQIHNIRFGGQVSVQINNGPWKHLYNDNVELYASEKMFDGIGGINATIRMDVPVALGEVMVGQENVVSFRLNRTDGVTTAIRVLDFNLKDSAGNFLIPASQFTEEDPAVWSAPSMDPADINAGEDLWRNGVLVNDSISQASIKATCMSCHFEDGVDLKYFNYSNESIIDRSRFHGLTYRQGAQVASYIRTRNSPAPGRPWNPPFQPGPGIDPIASDSQVIQTKKARAWMAGAGINAVSEGDQSDIFDSIFDSGSGRGDMADLMDHANVPVFVKSRCRS